MSGTEMATSDVTISPDGGVDAVKQEPQEPQMTMDDLLALPPSVPLLTAARALEIGKTLAYEQAAAGTFPIPVKRRGRKLMTNRADLFRELGLNPAMVRAPGSTWDDKSDEIAKAAS